MNWSWIKRLMPRGLYGRAALILILPIVTVQIVVSVVFIQRHFERVTEQMTDTMLREINFLIEVVESAPDLEVAQQAADVIARPLGLSVDLPADAAFADVIVGPNPAIDEGRAWDTAGARNDEPAPIDQRRFYDLSGKVVIEALRAEVADVTTIDLENMSTVRMMIGTAHGPMRVEFDRLRVSASNPHQLLVLMVAVSLLMTLIAFIFLRNQLRPIRRLAHAAEGFGKGQVLPYRPQGATEVRAAGAAFLEMRARIERFFEQRSLMLSGISHDLRTPLTRLRLGLSMLPPDEDVEAMERDVAEMGTQIDAFLAFMQGDAQDSPAQIGDPVKFVRDIVEDASRGGQSVVLRSVLGAEGYSETGEALEGDEDAALPQASFRPVSLRRAIENLIGNAVRYGTHAEVSLALSDRHLRIIIEDNGPGIAPDQRETALRPFTRLDPSRNQNKGQGVGLGLSIAADIARSHGGVLKLGESARLGGLKAELSLAR
ncbi:ATP-binding protein [Albirhodobacter sp. R86504]|uniref:ATP-binding protein n=1 Tax=Albirhodobacter sp. R86504 TaxID=3093848 RepID=UPI00366C2C7D